tara:strand:- start:1993 stop:2565 length:573 start_codon:yes stop_codon:yes gene_type:complete
MAFTLTDFKSNLFAANVSGGARPSLFKITISDSSNEYSLNSTESILVKAANIPAANIAALPVNYAGRAYKMTGFRTYDPWTVTIINDENFDIRVKIMDWMTRLAGDLDGTRSTYFGQTNTSGEATVTQVDANGNDVHTYKFYNLWPTELGEIALDWSSDAIEEYTCTWAYDYWSHGKNQEDYSSFIPPQT